MRSRQRGWWKTAVLVVSLCECIVRYLVLRLWGEQSVNARALWLHRSCQFVLRRLGFVSSVTGEPPACGLIVSNHLSYLDILFYGATLPCIFVAKAEVRAWPLLGLLAEFGGTIFVNRRSATSAARAAARLEELLAAGMPVLIFPEGTSSEGSEVLRFYPSLFEPAVRTGAAIIPAAIGYRVGDGAVERDLCYYGDISFAPHLLATLQLPEITADLHFANGGRLYNDRKQAAKLTREWVAELRSNRHTSTVWKDIGSPAP